MSIFILFVACKTGGGGRPGDTDFANISCSSLDVGTFASLAALSGSVPIIAVAHGRVFAGNAVFAGLCDVIIATERSNLGMAGPAMIEGGGLGSFRPEEIGITLSMGMINISLLHHASLFFALCSRSV